jgi:hypothetical protein
MFVSPQALLTISEEGGFVNNRRSFGSEGEIVRRWNGLLHFGNPVSVGKAARQPPVFFAAGAALLAASALVARATAPYSWF